MSKRRNAAAPPPAAPAAASVPPPTAASAEVPAPPPTPTVPPNPDIPPAADAAASPPKKKSAERCAGVDVVKIFAMYFVLSLHFCLHGGFYAFDIHEKPVCAIAFFRMLSYECVPLFLIISGFLMGKAQLTAKHVIKITPIVINTLLVSGLTITYEILVLHEEHPLLIWIESVYHLTQPTYGWYINMFIPLYMMMPFINAAYKGIGSTKKKIGVLLVLIFAANLAISVNRFKILPHEDGLVSIGFTPNYFGNMWPFAYYWMGLLIAEYRPRIPKWIIAPVLILLLCGEVALDSITAPELAGWNSGVNFTNEDFPNIFIAAGFFLLFYDLKIKNRIVCKILSFIAQLSMTVYLISFIGDSFYVRHFPAPIGQTPLQFVQRYFKIIPLEFLAAVAASVPIFYLGKLLSWLIMKPLLWLSELPARRRAKKAAAEQPAQG